MSRPRLPSHRSPPLWQVSVDTSWEAEEAVVAALQDVFQTAPSTYRDAQTGLATVSAHLEHSSPPEAQLLHQLRSRLDRMQHYGLNPTPARIHTRRLQHHQWADAWKKHSQAFVVRSRLLVRPSWSPRRPRPGQRVIHLDPGLSFGTGHHPTTRFCLDHLVACRLPRQPQSLLDIGTGSGLLAIAAAKIGYAPVAALDHDRQSVRVALLNARRNRVHHRIDIQQLDLRRLRSAPARRFDVVCANLTTDLLVAQRRRIAGQVKPSGTLLLAGVLQGELHEVRNAYTNLGFRTETRRTQAGWTSLRLRRSASEAR